MRYIDAFNHFFPKRIYELMLQSPAGQKDLGKRMQGIPALYNIEERLRVVDAFADYSQVIYERIERSGKPILLHSIRTSETPDYRSESKSKCESCSVICWLCGTRAWM